MAAFTELQPAIVIVGDMHEHTRAEEPLEPADTWVQAELEAAADRAAISAILEARGHDAEALESLRHAVALLEKVLGVNHYEVGVANERLARMVLRSGRRPEAAALFDRALVIFERTLGPSHSRTATCRANRNEVLLGPHP